MIEDQFIFASYINKFVLPHHLHLCLYLLCPHRNGARCISLLSSSGGEIKDLTEVDHGVALLIPHYDEDTNVIFLSAKVLALFSTSSSFFIFSLTGRSFPHFF